MAARLSTIEQLVGITPPGPANYGAGGGGFDFGGRNHQLPPFRSQQDLIEADQFFAQLSSNLPTPKQQVTQQQQQNEKSETLLGNFNNLTTNTANRSLNVYPTLGSDFKPLPPQQPSSPQQSSPQQQQQQQQSDFPLGSPNSTNKNQYPQLASRYDYDNGRRFSVGVQQRTAKPNNDDDATLMLTRQMAGLELDTVARHARIIAVIRGILQELIENGGNDDNATDTTTSSVDYPTIKAC
ncbi:hypothetical protein D0Z00_004386 [Geotrichum galactomycetum]|uniref:Uncharacterized protein n=1 Tax=Geotrichum galactomycetum TaxID=27317 RepID=A0ACB6UYI3_9ASCO|nr:hypothetical protein D0Z00_004386 [Geotrichum candidum]